MGLQRRDFFRDCLRRIIEPVAGHFSPPPHRPARLKVLRPPGSIDETRFADVCQRCGKCVEVCPAQAIFPLEDSYEDLAGTPAIEPSTAACVVCEGLKCTHVCPSGALLPLNDPHEIHMGLAEVYGGLCVRSRGEACTLCVDRCPLGADAIGFPDEGPPEVIPGGCVGCGVCELYCPTLPKAIVVRPL